MVRRWLSLGIVSDTVTVTVKPVDSEELTVLKFARIQYEDLIRGIRKSNP